MRNLRDKRRKNEHETSGSEAKRDEGKEKRVSQSDQASGNTVVVQEHGAEVLLIRTDLSTEQFPDSIKESRYSRSFIEHQKRLEETQCNVTVDHLLKSSLELDDTAKKKIEQLLTIGSKRFANDLVELLDSASKAIEQNANLLKILRHHLGLGGSHSQNNGPSATQSSENSREPNRDKT